MWAERAKAFDALGGTFKAQALIIERSFSFLDECIDLFEAEAGDSIYHRICGLTVVKAKNLALGSYSLILDGLGQESGALLRPYIEYYELLIYFRQDRSNVEKVTSEALPSAGNIAKAIGGTFHSLRKHLNEHASHSSYSVHSLNHLLDQSTLKFRKLQPMLPKVLLRNMGTIFAITTLLGQEALLCLDAAETRYFEEQGRRLDELKADGLKPSI